jgi:hypothetical protein
MLEPLLQSHINCLLPVWPSLIRPNIEHDTVAGHKRKGQAMVNLAQGNRVFSGRGNAISDVWPGFSVAAFKKDKRL